MSFIQYFHYTRELILGTQLQNLHRKRVAEYGAPEVLTGEQRKAAQKFYAPYAPHGKVDLRYHNFYTAITGQFHANYLPDELYYRYIDTYYNDWREARYADNKCFYHRMFQGVNRPEELAYRIKGLWFTGDLQQITRQELDALLSKEPEIVVKKAMGSEGGKGVYFLKGDALASVEGKILDDIVIQKPMAQHEAMAAINASSVNTIRIISLLSESGVKIYSAILRMGISGARVDNASSGGITCGITDDGKLKKYAYKVSGQRFDKHMDSGLVFEGYEIPGFHKCMEAVPKLHVQIPRFRLISWDFAVDPAGEPVLIEANLHYGELDFHQLNNGPLFGEDTEKILKEVFGSAKNNRSLG